jgi:hypothetical protein
MGTCTGLGWARDPDSARANKPKLGNYASMYAGAGGFATGRGQRIKHLWVYSAAWRIVSLRYDIATPRPKRV